MTKEETFIRTFFQPNRQERLLTLLADPTRRRNFLGKALHSCDFVSEHCIEIEDASQSAEMICRTLTSRGAPETCLVISESEAFDGHEFRLMDALENIVGKGFGTILICEPQNLGYYEGNDMEERMILQK
jgi:hypothetical protein